MRTRWRTAERRANETAAPLTQAVSAIRSLVPATLVIVTDIDRRIRLMMQYPVTTGRNFYEILRAIDTLQLTMCAVLLSLSRR